MSGQRLSAPLAGLVAVVTAAAVALLAVAAFQWHDEELALLSALAGLAIASEVLDFAPFRNSRVSISVALILTAGTVSGLPGVALVASVAMVTDLLVHPKPISKAAFNEGTLLLAGAAYVGVFEAFSTGYRPEDWPAVLGPALIGSAVYYAINSGLVALAIGLETGRHPFTIWSENFRWLLPHYILLGVLAVIMASAYDRWDLAGVALLLVPLAMVWFTLRQYAGMVSVLAAASSALSGPGQTPLPHDAAGGKM